MQKEKTDESEWIDNYLKAIIETYEISSLEVRGAAEIKHSEKETHAFSFLTNPFFSKEYIISVPYRAVYGIHFPKKYHRVGNTVYFQIGKAELQSLEFETQNKMVVSKEGYFVLDKDDKLFKFEKKLYQDQRELLANNAQFLNQAQKEAQKTIEKLVKPLNLNVEFESKNSKDFR